MTKRITPLLFIGSFALLALANGCTSEAGRDATTDETPGETPGADRPASPSEPPPAAPIIAADNKVLEWGFEPASADCNGWSVAGAEAIRAAPPRSGSYSCKVCGTPTTGGGTNPGAFSLSLSRDLGVDKAGHYVLTAWVRKRPQNAAPEAALARIEALSGGGTVLGAGASTNVAVREEWDRLEASVDLTNDNASQATLRVTIGSPTVSADRCLFVDDVTITRE